VDLCGFGCLNVYLVFGGRGEGENILTRQQIEELISLVLEMI
jgi:hypothetical protein